MMTAQAIAHRSRQMRRDWSQDSAPLDDIDRAAQAAVKRGIRLASSWLLGISQQLGHQLPIGNGTNGPWHRVPCITSSGHYGWIDTAHGIAIETDALCPIYVQQLAVPVNRTMSVNQAGGSSGIPRGWRQIVMILASPGKCRVRPPVASITTVIYGLQTCYGPCGVHPDDDWAYGHGSKWPESIRLMPHDVAIVATCEPQREEWRHHAGSKGIAREVVAAYLAILPWQVRRLVTHSGGNWVGWDCIYVTGTVGQRREARVWLHAAMDQYLDESLRAARLAVLRTVDMT